MAHSGDSPAAAVAGVSVAGDVHRHRGIILAMKTMPTRWPGSGASLIRFCESRGDPPACAVVAGAEIEAAAVIGVGLIEAHPWRRLRQPVGVLAELRLRSR